MTTTDLDAIFLDHGSHKNAEAGTCLVEAWSVYAGLPFGDQAQDGLEETTAAYARALNDVMPAGARQRLRRFIPLLGTCERGVSPVERGYLCADYAVRVFAVAALNAAGLAGQGEKLAGLPAAAEAAAASAAALTAARGRWEKPIELLEKLISMRGNGPAAGE